MRRTVDYFFAPQSPWAYLGHARFAALLNTHGAQVRVRPMDLGKVFPVSGGLPLPKRAPQRQAYRLVELQRFSQWLGVPLNLHANGDGAIDAFVKSAAISCCVRSRSLGFTRAIRTKPLFTEEEPKPGEVITKLTFFSGMESLINSVSSAINASI